MKRIVSIVMVIAAILMCAPAADARPVKKKAAKKARTTAIATFKVDGNTFQLLPYGKIKCQTDAKWSGSYKKQTEHCGFSAMSPEIDSYIISLSYSEGDGENHYLIFDDGFHNKNLYYLCGGSVGFDISVDTIDETVTITAEDTPESPETKEFDSLPVAGSVIWTKPSW